MRIGGSPGLRSWKLVLGVTGFGSLALAALPAAGYDALGLGEWSWPLGFLSVLVVLAGGILLGLHLAYGGIVWHPDERVAVLRGRRVPIDTITEAWRSLSSNGTASYLTYRFVSTDGPSVRVLVAGNPMKGLDDTGLQQLARFVAALPLVVPDARPAPAGDASALSDRQRAAAVTLTTGGGKSRVGREMLLDELRAAVAPTEAGDPATAAPDDDSAAYLPPASARRRRPEGETLSAREVERLVRDWDADDRDAARMLAEEPTRARPLRRLFFWLMIASLGVAVAVIILAIADEQLNGVLLDANGEDLIVLFIVGPGLLGLLFYIAWCAAADAHLRSVRRLGERWLDERAQEDPEVRQRGLATPLLAGWAVSVQRLRTVLAFLICLVGFFVMIAAIFFFTEEAVLGGVVALGVGLVLEVVAVLMFLRVQRQKRADAEQLVLLGGWRVLPPAIED